MVTGPLLQALRAASPAERGLLGPAAPRQQGGGTLPGGELGALDLQEDQQPFGRSGGDPGVRAQRLLAGAEKGQQPPGGTGRPGGSNT
ncbi:hypothetical protein LUX33_31635 [Actinomadura madurae]|uniref:hypothetical protein n=1 Tax=Actinomadura madurae TaxID=1993 RepID=UPI0020D205C9|nr:hypothetical protein [Actinomadura madurae]MCP9952536.1 hypothetical protein [Actinomadura madurae]MCP9969298.1 hypothetical protein [Actinomadura madurae]